MKKVKLNVLVVFDEEISNDGIVEVINNVSDALATQVNEKGLSPEHSNALTKQIVVKMGNWVNSKKF